MSKSIMAAKVARFFENAKIVILFSNFKELCKINESFAEEKMNLIALWLVKSIKFISGISH